MAIFKSKHTGAVIDGEIDNSVAHRNATVEEKHTKAQVGLGAVDNTSDADKPISTAQQAGFDLKLAKAGDTITNVRETVQSVTDGTIDVALGGIVTMTLSAPATLAISNLDSGQSLTLHIIGGDTHAVTWGTISWHGGVPTLGATHTVVLEQNGTTLYGYDAGAVV